MFEPGPADACTIKRHAARPHRMRGQHRASWAAELSPLVDGTQRRYTAVVGSAVAGASFVAMAAAAGMPAPEPDSAASEAVADVAELAQEQSEARPDQRSATAEAAAPAAPETTTAAEDEEERTSPVTVQPAQVKWTPMLDDINITSLFGQRWGRNHNGIDFSAATGTPIYAAYSGTVTHAGWESGYGNLVIIDHGEGVETYYAHNSEIAVSQGQWVEAGDHISDAGNTGFSFGSHLHFEIHVRGEAVEPLGYLESAGLRLP